METGDAGQLRKEVYAWVENEFECFLTDSQKGTLSNILKSVYEHRVIESRKENAAPMKHEITCPKCLSVKELIGTRSMHNYAQKVQNKQRIYDRETKKQINTEKE